MTVDWAKYLAQSDTLDLDDLPLLSPDDIREMPIGIYSRVRDRLMEWMKNPKRDDGLIDIRVITKTCMWCAEFFPTTEELEEHEEDCVG